MSPISCVREIATPLLIVVQRAEIILDWFGRNLGGRRPEIGWDHPSKRA